MKQTQVAPLVRALVNYAQKEMFLSPLDAIYAENQLLDLFRLSAPAAAPAEDLNFQTEILDPLTAYAVETGLCKEEERLLFETRVMGLVTPPPGEVQSIFENTAANKGVEAATDYLQRVSEKSNYIRRVDIDKNIRWNTTGPLGDLTVTINLSKPEKTAEQVAREKAMPQTGYPKCMLCPENMGFAGTLRHPARQTLRIIPVFLNEEPWYIQYSPYVYYENHCIAFSGEHRPMAITPKTFVRLNDFVDLFPHFFIGSNADLPIVGGSILAHDHFQGGKKVLPMFKRGTRATFTHPQFEGVEAGILDWYNSVVLLKSKNRRALEAAATHILDAWRGYSDESVDVLAYTDQPHNTITPIAEVRDGTYRTYLILRNNRTTAERPDGLFHPSQDLHNIKKEGIGLIEAMGLFILPGRLQAETQAIGELLTKGNLDLPALAKDTTNPLFKHFNMIAQLAYSFDPKTGDVERAITDYINEACVKILQCTAVFKNTEAGNAAFRAFLGSIGFVRS